LHSAAIRNILGFLCFIGRFHYNEIRRDNGLISEPLRGLLQIDVWQLVKGSGTVSLAVMGVLLMFSLNSITIIFAKFALLKRARNGNARFLRAFRKATRLDAVAAATEQFRSAPLATVF